MDSQVAHPQGQGYEQDPNALGLHSVVEGGDNEHHHEKKSVLKKVKAKAKKLKDTITKHGHGHGHDHPEGHVPDDHDLDEEDDAEEEVVEDPEILGAPVFESVAIASSVDAGRSLGTGEDRGTPTDARREEKFGKPGFNLGSTGLTKEELLRVPANTPQSAAPTGDPGTTQLSDPTITFVHRMGEAERGRPTVNLARPGGLEDPQSPRSRREQSNYQTKVTDPTASGGEEADVSPVVRSLGKMTVHDETEPKSGTDQSLPAETRTYISNIPTGTGRHDQFSPEPTSMDTDTASLGVDVTKPEAHPGDQTEHKPSSLGSYTEKLSSATSVIAEKAVPAKNLVASKLGYSERKSPKSSDATGSETHTHGEKPPDQSSYTGKVSSATSTIADKAMLAKNIVAAKLGYSEKGDTTTSHNTGGPNSEPQAHQTTAASGQPPEQSSYTGAISAVADKAISAKETVASKLGYAKKEGETETLGPGGNQPAKEQGKGIAAAVTEKLSPVISKVTGSMTDQRAEAPGEVAGAQAQDKGVSVRDYLAEKLKPGEEDKALSELISSALHKKKTEAEAEADTAVKVTESEEVKKRLGKDEEGQLNSPGKRIVDTVRGAVGSWFSKTDDSKASQQPARHDESEAVPSAADEPHCG
ncbi:low-temperature-induced 65 kDa protein-like isoform X2 [Rhodamnia argentea]|uniref:Low-temperature-induced 65 kDa protein-like isoform X2 n=1 Tax=Rhodamnia argentea TaxID=178133 RepID=A0A8B8PDW0_9MYRT|nr:low-temperature-induced 65 kDa protein-like isoform X2 [Rhodamnia argentea]